MKPKETDRIESAIRHIQTSTDIDPWALEIAVEAMQKQIDHIAESGRMVSISCGHENDLISRQMAIDTIMGQPPEPHYPAWYAAQIEELPAVQPDHNADISKKAEGDCISRQEALKICRRYWHPTFNQIMEEIEKLPSVQPDRVIIDDCLHHIYKNISVHTATGGVIAIRYYMEKLYEEIYGEGERPWWMT